MWDNIDPNTGAIAATESRAQAQLQFGVARDPLGRFFAVTEETNTVTFTGEISMFLFDTDTHELVKTSSPFASGSMTVDLAFGL